MSSRVTVTVFVGDALSLATEPLSLGEDLHADLSAFAGDFGLLNTGKPVSLPPVGVSLETDGDSLETDGDSGSAGGSTEAATRSVFVSSALEDLWFPDVSAFTTG